ncbi:MAG: hypothetical protein HKM06_02865 [Spirochaetales bacterium]|nr:hypothetical protein [Spirochaetales bacterium]
MSSQNAGTIIKLFHGFFHKKPSRSSLLLPVAPSKMQINVSGLMGMISQTEDDELDCGQTYELLDQYAEIMERGEDPQILLPKVYRHLNRCKDCHEELTALLAAIQSDHEKNRN